MARRGQLNENCSFSYRSWGCCISQDGFNSKITVLALAVVAVFIPKPMLSLSNNNNDTSQTFGTVALVDCVSLSLGFLGGVGRLLAPRSIRE
jgi:hypothetical protein